MGDFSVVFSYFVISCAIILASIPFIVLFAYIWTAFKMDNDRYSKLTESQKTEEWLDNQW